MEPTLLLAQFLEKAVLAGNSPEFLACALNSFVAAIGQGVMGAGWRASVDGNRTAEITVSSLLNPQSR